MPKGSTPGRLIGPSVSTEEPFEFEKLLSEMSPYPMISGSARPARPRSGRGVFGLAAPQRSKFSHTVPTVSVASSSIALTRTGKSWM